MKKWQIAAVATGVVTMLTAGTALAFADDGPAPSATPKTTPTSTAPRSTTPVSAEQAGKLAVAKVGGGSVDDIERESEHGKPEWDVDVFKDGKEYDVRVDASTGAITRLSADDDRDDRDDRGDDRDDRDDRADDDRSDDRRGDD